MLPLVLYPFLKVTTLKKPPFRQFLHTSYSLIYDIPPSFESSEQAFSPQKIGVLLYLAKVAQQLFEWVRDLGFEPSSHSSTSGDVQCCLPFQTFCFMSFEFAQKCHAYMSIVTIVTPLRSNCSEFSNGSSYSLSTFYGENVLVVSKYIMEIKGNHLNATVCFSASYIPGLNH